MTAITWIAWSSQRVTAFLGLVLLSSLLVSCRRADDQLPANPPPIEIRATVHPAQAMTVTTQIEGRVEEVSMKEGAKLAPGAHLATLSNALVAREAAVARAQLDWTETRMRRGGRAPVARVSEAPRDSLQIAARILSLRKARFDSMKRLRESRDVTLVELKQAEIEYLASLRDYNNERRAHMGGGAVASVAGDPELLRIEHQKQTAEERFAAERASLLRITSPIAGTVTRIHVGKGQNVFPRDPIADVSDTSTLHVRGNVAPELLRYIRPGMRVDVKILGVPARTFADEIESVVPGQGAGGESRTATIIVTIPNPDGSMQPNSEAMITLRSLR